jgi:uncharacterized protein (DUF1330 family)
MSTYLIVDLDVHDPEAFAAYRARVGDFIERHGGECLARGGHTEVHEGDFVPHRVVVFRFPDRESIHRFYADPEYRELAKIRHASARTIAFSVDGL